MKIWQSINIARLWMGTIYSRDKSTGLLNLEENYRDLFGPDPTDVAVGPEGKSLYITNSQDDELLVLEFDGETASADFF